MRCPLKLVQSCPSSLSPQPARQRPTQLESLIFDFANDTPSFRIVDPDCVYLAALQVLPVMPTTLPSLPMMPKEACTLQPDSDEPQMQYEGYLLGVDSE